MVRLRSKTNQDGQCIALQKNLREVVVLIDFKANLPVGVCGGKDQVSRSEDKKTQYLYQGDIPMYEDKTLICKDCGNEFVFTEGEQEFYAEKGFQNEPVRCKDCRDAKKAARGGERGKREMHEAVCSECGATCQIPFEPKNDRPIYCSDCFESHR